MRNKTSVIPYEEYIIVDTETTGFSIEQCHILQISAMRVRGGEEAGRFDTYVRQQEPVPERITELTGITDQDVAGAPSIEEALREFLSFAGDFPIAGHNISFDFRFLDYNARTYLKRPLLNRCVDTLTLARRLVEDCEDYKLKTLAERFQISTEGHHRADEDVRITYELICALSELKGKCKGRKGKEAERASWGVDPAAGYDAVPEGKTGKKRSGSYPQYIKASEITPETEEFDTSHPLFGKNIVFTGTLDQYDRRTAMQSAVNVGGRCHDNIRKDTDYLVLGELSFNKAVKGGRSSKVKKAEEMIAGGSPIRIIPESVFYRLLGGMEEAVTEPGGNMEGAAGPAMKGKDAAAPAGNEDSAAGSATKEIDAAVPGGSEESAAQLSVQIRRICEEVIREMDLPENGVYLLSYVSKRGDREGDETSKSICINEPEYPAVPGRKAAPNKSAIVMNIPAGRPEETELVIKKEQFQAIELPEQAVVGKVRDDSFTHVFFPSDSPQLPAYIKENIRYCVENYEAGGSFGCCSRFEECSDQGRCVHENKLYAKGCAYGKNLRAGKIFYGRNRNSGADVRQGKLQDEMQGKIQNEMQEEIQGESQNEIQSQVQDQRQND